MGQRVETDGSAGTSTSQDQAAPRVCLGLRVVGQHRNVGLSRAGRRAKHRSSSTLSLLFFLCQLQPLDEAVLQQKPSVNAVATLEKVIEIQSAWGGAEGLIPQPAQGAELMGAGYVCSP